MVQQRTVLAFQATQMTLNAFRDVLAGWKGTTMGHRLHEELDKSIVHTLLLVGHWWSRIHRSSQPSPVPRPLQIRSSIS